MRFSVPDDAWLTAFLEEYKALRAEIVDAIQAQRTVLQLGLTGESVLIGFAVPQAPSVISSTLLAVLVPSLTIFVVVAAWGDLYRAARASFYIHQREATLNAVYPSMGGPQGWETWIREPGKVYTGQTWGQFSVLYMLTLVSAGLGFITTFANRLQTTIAADFVIIFQSLIGFAAALGIIVPPFLYWRLRKQSADVFTKGVSVSRRSTA